MRYARWNRSLETGNVEVDTQHRALYDLVNDLNADTMLPNNPALAEVELERILRYAATHFATEEELMARSAYPAAETHIRLHRAFADDVGDLVARHLGGHGVTLAELATFMGAWLDVHINEQDRPLIEHLRRRFAT